MLSGYRAGAVVAATLVALVAPSVATADLRIFRDLNVRGLSAQDNESLGFPPDTTGAVSREHYVEVVNARIAVYDRTDMRLLSSLDATRFWGTDFATVVDPQVAWDDRSQRWYYVMLRNAGGDNGVLVAWSRSADPTDLEAGWCTLEIPTGELFDDYPKLGFSRNHLLIGTNVADLGERKLLFSRIWAIAKPQTIEGGCDQPAINSFGSTAAPLRAAGGSLAVTPVPATPVGSPRRGYVVAADCVEDGKGEDPDEPSCGRTGHRITVWHVSGPPGHPRLTRDGGVRVPRFRLPDPVPQPRTNRPLDASDTRLTQAVSAPDPSRGGARLIWTQHTIARKAGGSQARWYVIDPGRVAAVERGSVRKRGRWVFNAAISPTGSGDAAIINYSVGGPDTLPQIRARLAARPATELTLARSQAPDRNCDPPPADPYCNWGDYAGATPDPLEPNVVWGANQTTGPRRQADAFGFHWRTRIFALATR